MNGIYTLKNPFTGQLKEARGNKDSSRGVAVPGGQQHQLHLSGVHPVRCSSALGSPPRHLYPVACADTDLRVAGTGQRSAASATLPGADFYSLPPSLNFI